MAATRRLQKELAELRKKNPNHFQNIVVDESNILYWQGLIVPVSDMTTTGRSLQKDL
jgi:ubiquitin-conjugating enzyme E2 L3